MAKIPKPIFACFGINQLCQFWLFLHILPWTVAVFTCWCLPYLAKMSTIFILLHISLHSGFWFFHYACQIWQKFTTQFCQFWHNSATHIGINSGSFYMLIFAIFGKTSTIFILLYISLHSGFWFFHYACQIWQKFTIFQKWKPKPTMKCNREYYKNPAQVLSYLDMWEMNDWCSQFWLHHNTIRYRMLCIHKALVIELKPWSCQKWNAFQSKSFHIWQPLDLLEVATSWPWNIPHCIHRSWSWANATAHSHNKMVVDICHFTYFSCGNCKVNVSMNIVVLSVIMY